MGKRITIIVDDDLVKKLHEIQAKQIRQYKKSVSLSHVMNEVLRKSLK
jgi:predicted transcriptional regulator